MNVFSRSNWIGRSLGFATLAFALIAGAVSCRRATTADVRSITIAEAGDFFLYAPLYIAIDGGYFKQRGLDVKIVNTGGDDKTWAAVLSGSADFGVADPAFIAVSAERGQPGIVIASLVNGVPFWGITFKDIPEIKSGAALKNYAVATFPSPSTAFALQTKMFKDAGLAPNIRQGAFGTIIPMLKAGSADIGLELEPNVSEAARNGAKVVYSLATVYGDFAITGVTTSKSRFEKDPDLVKNVRAAIQDALNYIHKDQAGSLAKLKIRFPSISDDVARAALERVVHENIIPTSTVITRNAWQKAIALRKDVGDLKNDASYDDLVKTSP